MTGTAPRAETALEDFLTYLQDNGFPCGVGERVRAFRVVEHFRQQNASPRWRSLLGPIFARTPGELARFNQAFEVFFREGPPQELPLAVAGQAPVQSPPVLKEMRRPFPWKPVGVAFFAAIVLGALFYWDVPGRLYGLTQTWPPPDPPLSPSYPPAELIQGTVMPPAYRRVQRQRLITDHRPCEGRECVTAGRRPWAIAAPLLAALCFAFLARTPGWRRAQLLRRERRRAPPFSWPALACTPHFSGYRDLLINAAQVMNKRLAADSDQLDVPAAIRATIRAAGFPSIRFRKEQKPPEYLFLIDRRSPGDHFAAWWTALALELRTLGVRIDRYYDGGDSSLFHSANNAVHVTAHRLLDLYPYHSVLLLGESSTLLNPYSGELTSWAASLKNRDNRAVLTPESAFEWGLPEATVKRHLTLLPARVRNVPAMLKSFDAPVGAAPLEIAESDETAAIPANILRESETAAEIESAGRSLYFHLDGDVFQWLCACAVYPELQWELTMELGRTIDPSEALFSEPKLLQLIRLKWFRQGLIPGPWRAWLVGQLDAKYERVVRELLIAALLENRAPQNSFARDWQDLQVAAQRYWLNPRDARRRTELAVAMAALPAADVDRDYLLARLRAEWQALPMAQKLSAEQRRHWHHFAAGGWKAAAVGLAATLMVAAIGVRTPVSYQRQMLLPPVYEPVPTPVANSGYGVIAGKIVRSRMTGDGRAPIAYQISLTDGVKIMIFPWSWAIAVN